MDLAEPLPAGLLHTVKALACEAENKVPVVCEPKSATALPALKVGVLPVLVVVTPLNDHSAIGATTNCVRSTELAGLQMASPA